MKYFRQEFPTIAFKCSTQNQRHHLAQSSVSTGKASNSLLNTTECLGASTLLQLLKNYSRSQDIKTSITVGIIGYPNVGKSSLINSLNRSKVVGVGSTPGFTKVMQEVHLDKKVRLLDCPGIVFASGGDKNAGDIILRNCVKVEKILDPIPPGLFTVSTSLDCMTNSPWRSGGYSSQVQPREADDPVSDRRVHFCAGVP